MKAHADFGLETESSEYGPGALAKLPARCAALYGAGPYLVFSDETIWAAVSSYMGPFFEAFPRTGAHLLPGDPPPYASDALVEEVRRELSKSAAVAIAVGSGTINDVVKRASFELKRRYICVPTAPSVDGFTASGAAISVRGFKTTLECPAPRCVVAEEGIIVAAPSRLIASGYGDLAAKLTGGADWIIADRLGVEPIDGEVWDMVQPVARDIIGRAKAVREREAESIGMLYKGLISTGLAMQRYKDSRPASGSEHLLSHVWEMDHLSKDGELVSHGFKTGFGTLVIAAFMAELLGREGPVPALLAGRDFAPDRNLLGRRLELARRELEGSPIARQTEKVVREKTPDAAAIEARAGRAKAIWKGLGEEVGRQLPPFDELRARLGEAGCPTEPEELGLTRAEFLRGIHVASLIRRRYTVLDLASELGVLDETAGEVLSPRYFSRFA